MAKEETATLPRNTYAATNGTTKTRKPREAKVPTFMSRLAKIGEQFEAMSPAERGKMLTTLATLYPTAPEVPLT
jgi:hypothetical protein